MERKVTTGMYFNIRSGDRSFDELLSSFGIGISVATLLVNGLKLLTNHYIYYIIISLITVAAVLLLLRYQRIRGKPHGQQKRVDAELRENVTVITSRQTPHLRSRKTAIGSNIFDKLISPRRKTQQHIRSIALSSLAFNRVFKKSKCGEDRLRKGSNMT